jgi:hypothetical protein
MVDDDDNSGVGVGGRPEAIAVNQDTNTVYILDWDSNIVSVISTKNNTKMVVIDCKLGLALSLEPLPEPLEVILTRRRGEQAEKDQGQKRETERSDNDDAPYKLQCLTN